jgi:hypothetical protein
VICSGENKRKEKKKKKKVGKKRRADRWKYQTVTVAELVSGKRYGPSESSHDGKTFNANVLPAGEIRKISTSER